MGTGQEVVTFQRYMGDMKERVDEQDRLGFKASNKAHAEIMD